MRSHVTQDKCEIRIESRDAAASSILLYSIRLPPSRRITPFSLRVRSVSLALLSVFLCALFSHLMEYTQLVDRPVLHPPPPPSSSLHE